MEPSMKTSLRDYFRVLCYWKGIVVILFLVIALTTVTITFMLPPVYEAFTLILIERESRQPILSRDYNVAAVPPQLSVAEERSELAKTQSEIIKSRQILEKVALSLEMDRNFDEPNRPEKAINYLKDKVSIELEEETDIIKLSVLDSNPEMAAKIANDIADVYVNWVSELKLSKTKGASGVLSEQITSLDGELQVAEEKMKQLKAKGEVSDLKDEMSTTVTKLAEFNAEYDRALADIEEKKIRVEQLKKGVKEEGDLITVSQMINNPVADSLKLKLLELELKRTKLLARYNKGSAPLESIDEEIAQTKVELNAEITNTINSIETDLAALEARKQALEGIKNKYSLRLQQLAEVEADYRKLERQLKGKSDLYTTLLGKQAEATLKESMTGNLLVNARVIDPAKTPLEPVRPKKILNTILGCVVGLMCGVGGAFLREYWDHSIKTVDEVKRFLGLNTLASVPRAKARNFMLYSPGSSISESFHALSTNIQQLCREKGINVLLIASANKQEGKSVVSANLAMSLASIEGKKVLVIDANLRQPAINRIFELRFRSNIIDVLLRNRPLKPDVTDIKNLSVIGSTEEVSEPSRLLASDAMKEFINDVKQKYDYVIIDSPALMAYPDAANLAFESEGIILVVEFGQTRREVVERAESLLNSSQRKILGVVLNKFEYIIPETLYKRL